MKEDKQYITNTSILNKSKIKSQEILSHSKYIEIYEKFVKLFKSKGYSLSDSFGINVWFLKNDLLSKHIVNDLSYNKSQFNESAISHNTPLIEKNRLHEILFEINENIDFSNLLVSVDLFIYKIIESLIIALNTVNRSNRTIESFQAYKRTQIIKECIRILEMKIDKLPSSTVYESKMTCRIKSVLNFTQGEYDFYLKLYMIKNGNMNQININLKNNDSKIIVTSNGDMIEDNSNRNMFEEIIFSQIQIDENETKAKSSTYSGTSFSNFLICCNELESKKTFLLDIMLNTIDNIQDISKSIFKENLELTLSSSFLENMKRQGQINPFEKAIILECLFEFDPLTRISLLKRIGAVFSEVIETKRISESIIDTILDLYFFDISDSVKYILTSSSDSFKNSCCECLII